MNKSSYKDHLGNEFTTKKNMLEYWGITRGAFNHRLERGWSLKDALTVKYRAVFYYDHLGNRFESKEDMCNYWGVARGTFDDRIRHGYSLQEALTEKINNTPTSKQTTDHLGNEFNSIIDKCKYWNIKPETYKGRIKLGYSEKDALTLPLKNNIVKDFLGNEFSSIFKMCKYWGVNYAGYTASMRYGHSQIESLKIIPSLYVVSPSTKRIYNYKINNNFIIKDVILISDILYVNVIIDSNDLCFNKDLFIKILENNYYEIFHNNIKLK